jgi:hypothetical protein
MTALNATTFVEEIKNYQLNANAIFSYLDSIFPEKGLTTIVMGYVKPLPSLSIPNRVEVTANYKRSKQHWTFKILTLPLESNETVRRQPISDPDYEYKISQNFLEEWAHAITYLHHDYAFRRCLTNLLLPSSNSQLSCILDLYLDFR